MLSKTYGTKSCMWCGKEFTASKSNQIYCKNECTRKASNQKIIERYHASKAAYKDRFCRDCSIKLSRYNTDVICNACQRSKKDAARMELLKKLGFEYIEE